MERSMQWIELTRNRAADLLGQTHLRRSIGTRVVASYVGAMNNDDWKGELAGPIVLDPDDQVLDGNHRLTAFLQSDLEVFPTWVLTTQDPEAVLTIDTGKPRSLADQLQLRGHENAIYLQAHFRTAWKWSPGDQGRKVMSRPAQVRWVESNPNAVKAAGVAALVRPQGQAIIRFPVGTVACLYDIACYAEGGDSLEEFATGAAHGSITFPTLSRLQQRLADHTNPRNTFRMSPEQISYLVTSVYLAWLNDDTKLEKLYATRKVLRDLPGWSDWLNAMWPEPSA